MDERRVKRMSLTSLVLRYAARIPRLESMDRFLFVGPHPDDIEIGAGATAAKLAKAGRKGAFLICLDGRYGDGLSGEVKGDALALLRRKETVEGAAALGVTQVFFLGRKKEGDPIRALTAKQMESAEPLCDGGFYAQEDLVQGIGAAAAAFQPDVIFGPDPFSRSECHADHLNVGNAVRKVACFAPYPGIMERIVQPEEEGRASAPVRAVAFYMTARPNQYVRTSRELTEIQFRAIAAHGSQFPADSEEFGSVRTYLRLRSLDFGLRRLRLHAEGFRVYGQTQMHCLPEAGE